MNSSSNYNCISADCARVVYREYLPPVVRWRYPDEEWQEIEADDYSIESESGQCYTQYIAKGNLITKGGRWACDIINLNFVSRNIIYGKIISTTLIEEALNPYLLEVVNEDINGTRETKYINLWLDNPSTNVQLSYSESCQPSGSRRYYCKVENLRFERVDEQVDNCGDCILTITKNGEIVHEKTRDICPEVEKLPCRLADISKEIKIEKIPYLSAIEVTQIDNDAVRVKGVPFPLQGVGKAPDECWNIYRNEIFDPFPDGDPDDPNEPAFGDFINQICSAFSCPPPEYEVICNCNEQCPDGTCAVYCGEYICCYDSTGRAVKAIHYSDLPDFGIPDNTAGGTSA